MFGAEKGEQGVACAGEQEGSGAVAQHSLEVSVDVGVGERADERGAGGHGGAAVAHVHAAQNGSAHEHFVEAGGMGHEHADHARVLTVPKAVPMSVLRAAQNRKLQSTKKVGLMSARAQSMSMGMVPLMRQMPVSMPMSVNMTRMLEMRRTPRKSRRSTSGRGMPVLRA